MSAMWVRGRAAERFDAAVAGASDGPSADRAAVAPAELLAVVDALRALPEVTPRPEHTSALRERLMVEADRLAALRAAESPAVVAEPGSSDPEDRLRLRVSRRHPRRFAVLAGTVAALGASTSVAVAAQSALPGESLYPVKRALEDAQAGVTRDPADRGELLLVNAADRLGEASSLLAADEPASSAEVAPTLDSFTEQASDGAGRLLAEYARSGDRELVTDLRDFAAVSSSELDDMAVGLPTAARDAWTRAVRAVEGIEADTALACPLCVADPTGFESGDERLSAGDELPGSGTSATALPQDDTADGAGTGERPGRDGGQGRGRGLTPGPDSPGGPGGRGDGRGDGSDDRGDGSPVDPSTPPLPESGGGLGDVLGDGLASGLGGGGLGEGLRDGLRDGLGLGGSGAAKNGGGDRDQKKRGGSGRGSGGGLGDGLDDLLP